MRPLRSRLPAACALAALVALAACTSDTDGAVGTATEVTPAAATPTATETDTETVTETDTATATATATETATAPATPTDSAGAGGGPEGDGGTVERADPRWAGQYTWTEPDRTYTLAIEPDSSAELQIVGIQEDQTLVGVAVATTSGGASIVVQDRVGQDLGYPYESGAILFRLEGDPDAPTTIIRQLRVVQQDLPDEGTYFARTA